MSRGPVDAGRLRPLVLGGVETDPAGRVVPSGPLRRIKLNESPALGDASRRIVFDVRADARGGAGARGAVQDAWEMDRVGQTGH